VKVGLLVNVNNHTVDPATLAAAVEEVGFESFWVGDHPAIPYETRAPMQGSGGEIPEAYAHVSDPFVALSFAAAATTELKLGTGICIVTARHPVMNALQVATLDHFSGGRLLFGVGCGWLPEELELFGVDYPRRLAQAREHVEAMRALWSEPEEAFEGEWTSFPRLKLNPRPAQHGGPPVLLGSWGEGAPARVAEWADGWLPMLVTPAELAAALQRLREECAIRGRDPDEIEVTLFEYDPGDDRDACRDLLARYEEAGADRVVVIAGLGDHMGAHEWGTWGPERYRDQLNGVAARFL
jgi:probable F420-dependent oxidoreductase